jgi:hypothetical protein
MDKTALNLLEIKAASNCAFSLKAPDMVKINEEKDIDSEDRVKCIHACTKIIGLIN